MNCKIIIEQYCKGVTHKEYEFDDFRVATAIANLLDNISDVKVTVRYYDPNKKKENTNND